MENLISDFIKQVGRFTVGAMRYDLQKQDLADSNLFKNIRFVPMKTRVTIELPGYANFVDRGVNGAVVKKYNTKLQEHRL
jgi:hypothetical protein